jgi:recombination protein RecA
MSESKAEKFKVLAALSRALDKKHEATNTLVRLGSKNIVSIPSIPTQLPTLDFDTLQFGGIPRGRIIELFGAESAGKTTTVLHIIAEEQKLGGIAVFVDAEHALSPEYAEDLGVNIDDLVMNQPSSGEEALHNVDELVASGAVSLIVVDSAAALVPEAELAGDIGDAHIGLQARLLSQAMRVLTGKCSRTKTTLIFTNQIREKIGILYGNPEVTCGGRALKFYSSLRLQVSRKESITEGNKDNIVGHKIDIRAVKNRGGVPFRRTQIDLIYPGSGRTAGFDKVSDMITYASNHGLFEMNGSWYSIDGVKVANGLPNLKTYLRGEPKAIEALQKKVEEFVKKQEEVPSV